MSSKRTRNANKNPEIALTVFSNEPKSSDYDLLQMLYTGAFSNQLGLMFARNKENGEVHRLIVGTEWNAEKGELDTYPLARLLEQEEINSYEAPDGKGGYG